MRAGLLRHRITIETATETPSTSGTGERVKVWTDIGTFWASVEPLAGKELVTAQQTVPNVTHKITIRGTPPSPQARIRWKNRIFNVTAGVNWMERGIYSSVFAEERVGVTP